MSDQKPNPDQKTLHRSPRAHARKRQIGGINRTASADSGKSELRSIINKRIHGPRSKSVERFKHLVQRDYANRSILTVSDLKEIMQGDPQASNLLRDQRITQLLEEIEHDMAHLRISNGSGQSGHA